MDDQRNAAETVYSDVTGDSGTVDPDVILDSDSDCSDLGNRTSTTSSSFVGERDGHDSINTTPGRRDVKKELSKHVKQKVQEATKHLTKLRCVILNSPQISGVHYVHILPRSTKPSILTQLEYSWGMKFETLDVDTQHNIFRLNAYMHHLFDHKHWVLLPEESLLSLFRRDAKNRPNHKSVKELLESSSVSAPYRYRLVPSLKLRSLEIRRNSADLETLKIPVKATNADFDSYYYPFDSFPSITSHIHPHFVIFNTGHKLIATTDFAMYSGLYSESELSQTIYNQLIMAVKIYKKWTHRIPENSDFFPGNQCLAILDDRSAGTGQSCMETRSQKLFRSHANTTPLKKSHHSHKRQRGLEEGNVLQLDNETPGKRLKQQKESVTTWISSLSDVKFDAIAPF